MSSTSSKSESLIGTRLDDRYELEELVGKGGMGEVYRARQLRLNRLVAVKIPRKGVMQDQNYRVRFNREAHSMARVQHEHICQIFDVYLSEDAEKPSYLVLEYVQGIRFDRWVSLNLATLTVGALLDIVAAIAGALDAAHQMNIVHRDIKPSNILITADGVPKIMDFGVAQVPDDIYTTRSGIAIGTPAFMAPEQVRGKDVGPKADQYAFAMTLYKVFTGRIAFEAERSQQLAYMQLNHAPAPPSEYNPNLPFPIELIILKALGKEPGDRFANCSEMVQFMETVLGEHRDEPVYPLFAEAARYGTHRLEIGPQFDNLFGANPWYRRYFRELLLAAAVVGGLAALVLIPFGATGPTVSEVTHESEAGAHTSAATPGASPQPLPTADIPAETPAVETAEAVLTSEPPLSGPDALQAGAEVVPSPTPIPTPVNRDPKMVTAANPGDLVAQPAAPTPSPAGTSAPGLAPLVLAAATPYYGYDPTLLKRDELLGNAYELKEAVYEFMEADFPRLIGREDTERISRSIFFLKGSAKDGWMADFEAVAKKYKNLFCDVAVKEYVPYRDRVELEVQISLIGVKEGDVSGAKETLHQSKSNLAFTLESRQGDWFFTKIPRFMQGIVPEKAP